MFEGFIAKVSPSLAKKRAIERYQLDIVKKMNPINYGEHAGSHRKKAFRFWNPKVRSPDEDIGNHKDTLTGRSRDLVMGTPLALGAVRKIRTNVVGIGLRLKSTIDADTIGIDSEEKAVLEKHIEKVWELWAESTACDMSRMSNFYELQSIAILSALIDGDCFALLPLKKRAGEVFDLKIQLVESERCQSPPSIAITKNIRNGVEIGENGEIKAYHFAPPYNWAYTGETEYTRVDAYGSVTGRKNVLLLMEKERIGQRRGVPLLAPVMEAIKQLGRYTNAELTAAVVSAMFTVFVENKLPETTGNAFNGLPSVQKPPSDRDLTKDIAMGNGTIVELDEGQTIKESNPNRPNTAFEGFMKAMCMQIGSALELPHEVLLNSFNSSYSASRAALLEAWKMYKMRRAWFVDDFCSPIFHEFMDEAVAKGYINAPGYFENPLVRKAYLKCEWYGPTQGQLNPLQEVSAAIKRVENDFSTRSREAREMNGSSWNDNIKQRIIEEKNRKELIESGD
jgi:lambda family phage portal protein